jgi:hypothetical protein
VKPAASTPEPAPEADAKDSMKALDPEVFEGAGDQQDAADPTTPLSSAELAAAIRATAPQVAALVPDLLARAKAANAVWRENYANLPDPEELGIDLSP